MTEDIQLTIGSDPEFVIMCGDSVENALEIFQRVGDMECQCECPHPDEDDIENIYDEDVEYYIGEAIGYKDGIYFIKDYDFLAVETLLTIHYPVDIKELLKIDKFKEAMLLYDEEYDDGIINFLTKEDKHKVILEESIDNTFQDKFDIIKEILLKETEYLTEIYNSLPDDKQRRFDSIITDSVGDYLYDNFDTLDELPDEIQYNIKKAIIENYEVDCSSCSEQESYFCTTEIGCDGQSALGELRPKHGNNPIEHFKEILKLMEELNDLLEPEIICYGDEQLQVKAGAVQGRTSSEPFQLGGHIHLGSVEIDSLLKSNVGEYLSFFCGIPLTLITDTENRFDFHKTSERNIRHAKNQYGAYSSYREKLYGIEFRMPSSWLVSPQVTIGALSLAYVVVYEFLSKSPNEQHIWNEIFEEEYLIHPDKYIHWYNNQNWVILQGEIEPIKLEIQQMELYPEYKTYIDYIFNMIDRNETWHSEGNILSRWAELW